MKTALIDKLAASVAIPITTEEQVYAILARTRKILELTNEFEKYQNLGFYCDWAFHTTMNKAGAQRILKAFDKGHPLLSRGALLGQLPEEVGENIRSITALWRFQEQMREFLRAHQIPTDLNDEFGRWESFLYRYAGIVEDCPLQLKADPELRYIRSAVVKKIDDPLPLDDETILFHIIWSWVGRDRRRVMIDVDYIVPLISALQDA